MSEPKWIKGSKLRPAAQEQAKRQFAHRFTKERRPSWASGNKNYKPQFTDDADWLANTEFAVTKSGALDARVKHCVSWPTWPEGKGIWGSKGIDW